MLQTIVQYMADSWAYLPKFYDPIRIPMYTSFFTVASLLLAMQNLLVINLNRDVYSDPEYRRHVRENARPKTTRKRSRIEAWLCDAIHARSSFWPWLNAISAPPSLDRTVYGPLRRLSNYLRTSTVIVLLCALVQVIVGAIKEPWAAAICIACAGLAIFRVFEVLRIQKLTTDAWLSWLSDKTESALNEKFPDSLNLDELEEESTTS